MRCSHLLSFTTSNVKQNKIVNGALRTQHTPTPPEKGTGGV